jgi:hypothetical protein
VDEQIACPDERDLPPSAFAFHLCHRSSAFQKVPAHFLKNYFLTKSTTLTGYANVKNAVCYQESVRFRQK